LVSLALGKLTAKEDVALPPVVDSGEFIDHDQGFELLFKQIFFLENHLQLVFFFRYVLFPLLCRSHRLFARLLHAKAIGTFIKSRAEVATLHRFGEIAVYADIDPLPEVIGLVKCRQDDDGDRIIILPDFNSHGHAIHDRHPDVCDDNVGPVLVIGFHAIRTVARSEQRPAAPG